MRSLAGSSATSPLPALSPAFEEDWEAAGHIEAAVQQVTAWIESRPVAGMRVDVQRLAGRTPLIVVEVEPFGAVGTGADGSTVVLYGHLDKQPEMSGWRDGLGPWTPVRIGDRLYGRGGADDGYAAFAGLAAIEARAGRRRQPQPVCVPDRGLGGIRQRGPPGAPRRTR